MPSFTVIAMEAVQAIQRATNEVPLIVGKRTIVRAFVDSGLRRGEQVGDAAPNEWPNVTGTLTVTDPTTGTVVGTLSPLNSTSARNPPDISRERWADALNFELVPEMVRVPSLNLTVTVSSLSAPSVPVARRSMTVAFISRPRQPLVPILVRLSHPELTREPPTIDQFKDAVLRGPLPRYPVAEDGFIIQPEFGWDTTIFVASDWPLAGLLNQISTVALLGANRDGIRCAVLPHIIGARGGIATTFIWGSRLPTFIAQVTDVESFAHEMAHTFGIGHSPCTGTEEYYDNSRYMPGRIDDVGVDPVTRKPKPRGTPDVMSYCENRWCSVQFYRAMLGQGVI
jgi:hypothetical protein